MVSKSLQSSDKSLIVLYLKYLFFESHFPLVRQFFSENSEHIYINI